jgi:hypothetical protein
MLAHRSLQYSLRSIILSVDGFYPTTYDCISVMIQFCSHYKPKQEESPIGEAILSTTLVFQHHNIAECLSNFKLEHSSSFLVIEHVIEMIKEWMQDVMVETFRVRLSVLKQCTRSSLCW